MHIVYSYNKNFYLTVGGTNHGRLAEEAIIVFNRTTAGDFEILYSDQYTSSNSETYDIVIGYSGGFTGQTAMTLPVKFNDNREFYVIAPNAFNDLKWLEDLTLGTGLTAIGADAFSGCINIKKVQNNSANVRVEANTYGIPGTANITGSTAMTNVNGVIYIVSDAYNDADPSTYDVVIGAVYDTTHLKLNGELTRGHKFVIAERAFANNTLLTKVTLGAGLYSIGDRAFIGCTSLTTVDNYTSFPIDSLSQKGDYGYVSQNATVYWYTENFLVAIGLASGGGDVIQSYFDANITTLNLPAKFINDTYEIADYVFNGYAQLTTVNFADGCGLTKIGEFAFNECVKLTGLTLPSKLEYIGRQAFYKDGQLYTVVIPDSVTYIGSGAFQYCSLISVTLGQNKADNKLTKIESAAFAGGKRLIEVVNNSNLAIVAGSGNHGSIAENAAIVKTGSSSMVKQDDYYFLTVNGKNYLTAYCGADTDLTLPENFNGADYEINKGFIQGSGITSVVIPKNVTAIGDSAFNLCEDLASVTFAQGSKLTTIGDRAFYHCPLSTLVIPDSVTTIGEFAFAYCFSYDSMSTNSITLGKAVTTIKDAAFLSCYFNTIHNYSGLALVIGAGGSDNENAHGEIAREVNVIYNYKVIGNYAVTIQQPYDDNNVETYDVVTAYLGSKTATSVSLPASFADGHKYVIADGLFRDMTELTTVSLGRLLYSIGTDAFDGCAKIATVHNYSQSITVFRTTADNGKVGLNASEVYNYLYKSGLYYFASSAYDETDVATYDKVVGYDDSFTELIFPDEFTVGRRYVIADSAFRGNKSITKLEFGTGLYSVGLRAFKECDKITEITFKEHAQLKTIGEEAFQGAKITTLYIPSTVTSIGKSAFSHCTELTTVTFHERINLTTISESMFYSCQKLSSITIPTSVTSIGHSAFMGCTGLTSIVIPETVTSIANYAFCDWTQEQTINFVASSAEVNKTENFGWNDSCKATIVYDYQPA